MEKFITKKSIGILLAGIFSIGAFWIYLIIKSTKSSLDITAGLFISIIALVVMVIRWRRSVAIEGNRIVLHSLFTTRTINIEDLMGVQIKSGSIGLIKNDGITYNILINWFRKDDAVFLKGYFERLREEISLSEKNIDVEE